MLAEIRAGIGRVIQLAIQTCGDLHPRRAQIALLLIGQEGGIDGTGIIAGIGEVPRQHHCILGCHIRALGQVLQHRMRRIAQQGDIAAGPVADRLAIAQHPHLPGVDARQVVQHHRLLAAKTLLELLRIAVAVPAFLVAIAVKHHHQVVDRATGERVVHQMGLGAGMQHDIVFLHVRRQVGGRDHRAIGDMP